jgi:FAD/FMN-containing dehydrogenase
LKNADLFWALRGGSGNFGVVTGFEYTLHPMGPVLAGMAVHPHANAVSVLRFYLEFAAGCPDELSTALAMLCLPDGTPIVAMVACYCGDLRPQRPGSTQSLRRCLPPDHKVILRVPTTVVGEPEERESFRLPLTAFPSIGRREAPELDQPRLFRMDLQSKLRIVFPSLVTT